MEKYIKISEYQNLNDFLLENNMAWLIIAGNN